ncbi:MAG: thiocyanate hydrolase, partial [Mycobacterium sp.]
MNNAAIPPQDVTIETLVQNATRNQTWPVMADKYGVENPVPPWKTSLDGIFDAIDHSYAGDDMGFTFKDRRDEEDVLSVTRHADLPYPENQLVAHTYLLVARGVIDEGELKARLTSIRNRL